MDKAFASSPISEYDKESPSSSAISSGISIVVTEEEFSGKVNDVGIFALQTGTSLTSEIFTVIAVEAEYTPSVTEAVKE